VREAAGGHGGADVGGVARPLEEVGVDVEGDRRARVAEDAADLADVEGQVDDEMAGEGVAQVVEAKRRPAPSVEVGARGHLAFGPRQPLAGDRPEGEARPERQQAVAGGLAQELALDPRLLESPATVRRLALPSIITQTAYLPFGRR
jgi:hypothetical protein